MHVSAPRVVVWVNDEKSSRHAFRAGHGRGGRGKPSQPPAGKGLRQEILDQSSKRAQLNMNGEKNRTQGKDSGNEQRQVRSCPAACSWCGPRYRQDGTCAGRNSSCDKYDQREHCALPPDKRRLCRIFFAFLAPTHRAPHPGPTDSGYGDPVVGTTHLET